MTSIAASMTAVEQRAIPTTAAERERAAKATASRLSERIVVGGKLAAAATRERFEVENPTNAEVIGHAPRCGTDDVDRAIMAAAAAFPRWSAMPERQRSTLLLEMASRLEREAESLAQLSALETGNAVATQTRGEPGRWSIFCASLRGWRAK
jgi:acyl-CoA reductase-like NAD-dependent aldehyde dehydrogenase